MAKGIIKSSQCEKCSYCSYDVNNPKIELKCEFRGKIYIIGQRIEECFDMKQKEEK